MRVIHNLFDEQFTEPTAITIGNFDGVHLGHRHLIQHVVNDARRHGWTPTVVTFQPHPRRVLQPGARMVYICSWEERLALLERAGIDLVAVVRFTLDVARMSAREFVLALVERLHMRSLWVGPDFALGHQREGDVRFLQRMANELGFAFHVVLPFTLDGEEVRSSRIRELVAQEGNVRRAARLLGRYFSLSGLVVHGDGRGRQIGVPTANLAVAPTRLIPANGVYATWAWLDGQRWPSATNIGVRPTVSRANPTRTVETHIIGFQGNIYHHYLRLEFVERLRDEQRFETLDALIAQIRQDIKHAAALLAEEESHEWPIS